MLIRILFLTFSFAAANVVEDGDHECHDNVTAQYLNKVELKRCLLSTYFKHDSPRNTNISVTLAPLNLLLVDDHDERVNLVFDIKLSWHDERMQWHAQPHDQFDSLELLEQEIWLPTVEVVNRLRSRTSYMIQWIHIATTSNGSTHAHGQFFDDISCKMDAYFYPFDSQQCPLLFAFLYGARPNVLNFSDYSNQQQQQQEQNFSSYSNQQQHSYGEKYLNKFAMHRVGEWHMECCGRVDLVAFERNKLFVVMYTVKLKRSWVQPVMTWVLPPIVISMAGVVSLHFGCKPTEHHSFGASIVITMTLLLTGLYARLPASGTGFPIIGQLYLGLSLSILVSMSLSTMRFDRKQHVPTSPHRAVRAAALSAATANGAAASAAAAEVAAYAFVPVSRRNSYVARGLLRVHLLVSRKATLSRAELEYRIKLTCVGFTLLFNVATVVYVFVRWLIAYTS